MNLFRNVFAVMQTVCVLLAVNSCSKIDELESRVVTLEKTVSELQSFVNSGYVVTNYSQNDEGWVLSLSNGTGASKTLNIYNGIDGAMVPVVRMA